ncbi:2OG-Fe(II) oxygenase [Flavobacterium sp. LS1P28]|uniref:2OG-Fe(II) oxygenase n=1 Tax=Flavobacterium sp. LS1P28 TaxID=2497752 RepID=UPI000F8424A2|nr:2OG-Fe(II) oxygenase [Flavobacterium sp. LS1P28]RTY83466.1 2OG-Fe(II) oxygenase [Flavobacterium sp. LS1P28]
MKYSRTILADLIFDKLSIQKENLKREFNQAGRINSSIIDDLLPVEVAKEIYNAYPSPEEMAIHKSLRENKRVAAQMDLYNPLLEEIVYAFQDQRIVKIIEEVTGLKEMIPDEHLYAGGISLMAMGNFLNPHLDNSHDNDRENYRVLNLLYYVTPDWDINNGGNLELWDNGMGNPQRVIHSKFNRLVLMVTNKSSIHSVSKVTALGKRCCVSNYYFSEKPAEASEYFHVTSFYGRPEEPVKNLFLRADAFLRQTIRKVLGKRIVETKHIYKK